GVPSSLGGPPSASRVIGSPLGSVGAAGNPPEPIHTGASRPRATALPPLDQLPHDVDEFGRLEGLGEKGVDPDLEPALDLVRIAGTDDGERQIAGTWIRPQPRSGPDPVQSRHDHIKGDGVGPHLMNDFETLGTIGRGHDLDALQLEIDPDQLPDDLVVVDNKNPARRP